jgi:predicted unusual protein kinase regulating ubiquinone biosynthesis (AarF/ABC1/UbiB family)
MLLFINKILFFINTFYILLFESLIYVFTRDYEQYIINISDKLSKINIFYIKILQALSMNNEIFTPIINEYLLKFTDKVDFTYNDYNFNHIINTISYINNYHSDYNIDINSIYQINSGMISIVYKGKMNKKMYNNKNNTFNTESIDIVIKLLRNNIEEYINESYNNIIFLINVLNLLPYIKYFNILDILEENKLIMLLQINFKNEVENIRLFKNKNKNIDYIVVPEPYEIFTKYNKNLIVMDYINGLKLNKICKTEKEIYLLQLAKFGIKSILYDGIYHGDIHPGNILFLKENNCINDRFNGLKLGIIDYGIVGKLNNNEQEIFYNFFTLLYKNDYTELSLIILNELIMPIEIFNNLSEYKKSELINRLEKIIINTITINKTFTPKDIFLINKLLSNYNLKLSLVFSRIQMSMAISDSVSKQLHSNITYVECVNLAMNELLKSIEL